MFEPQHDEKCPHCDGRGYLRCACWPGDCICGEDDRDCDACFGTGFADDFDDVPPVREPLSRPETKGESHD